MSHNFKGYTPLKIGFLDGSVVKNLPANAGDTGDTSSVPGSRRFLGRGNGNPLQYSYLENTMDRGAWRAPVHGPRQSRDSIQSLSNYQRYFSQS